MEYKKIFSKIGFIFVVFSIATFAFQWITLGFLQLFSIENSDIQMIISTLVLYLTGIVVFALSKKRVPLQGKAPEKKKMSALSLLKAFCMCYTLLIFSNLLGTFLTSVIGAMRGKAVVNPVETIVFDMSIPVMFLLTVVLAPIFEELFFRKFLIDRTLPFGEGLSVVLSGGMFGLFHGNLSQFPYAFAIGCFFAYLYIRTGKIGYPILLHAIVNFLGSIVAVFVLNNFDYNTWLNFSPAGSEQEILQSVITLVTDRGFLIFILYEAFVYILVVIGFILWIANFKQIRFRIMEREIPKREVWKVTVLNAGMMSYIAFWGVNMILATLM